jgi:hypothetical protein
VIFCIKNRRTLKLLRFLPIPEIPRPLVAEPVNFHWLAIRIWRDLCVINMSMFVCLQGSPIRFLMQRLLGWFADRSLITGPAHEENKVFHLVYHFLWTKCVVVLATKMVWWVPISKGTSHGSASFYYITPAGS